MEFKEGKVLEGGIDYGLDCVDFCRFGGNCGCVWMGVLRVFGFYGFYDSG